MPPITPPRPPKQSKRISPAALIPFGGGTAPGPASAACANRGAASGGIDHGATPPGAAGRRTFDVSSGFDESRHAAAAVTYGSNCEIRSRYLGSSVANLALMELPDDAVCWRNLWILISMIFRINYASGAGAAEGRLADEMRS